MALTRAERFRLKSRLMDEVDNWSARRTNVLLGEFGLDTLGSWNDDRSFEDVISGISDAGLMEMYAIALDIDQAEVQDSVDGAEAGNWKPGYVRLFMTHSAQHKAFVGEVEDRLAVVGVHGFVAHTTMAYSKPWQAQIEQALRTMQAFVAIIHPECNDSAWCHQETGWALGRRIPHYAIRMGADPAGFIGSHQWPSAVDASAEHVASIISGWIATLPELGEAVVDGLFSALGSAGNYFDAGATAERIATLGSLTDEQFARLDAIWWSNNQLHGGYLPSQAMAPFYQKHGRDWPPPKPVPLKTTTPDPWAAPAGASDEPPF